MMVARGGSRKSNGAVSPLWPAAPVLRRKSAILWSSTIERQAKGDSMTVSKPLHLAHKAANKIIKSTTKAKRRAAVHQWAEEMRKALVA